MNIDQVTYQPIIHKNRNAPEVRHPDRTTEPEQARLRPGSQSASVSEASHSSPTDAGKGPVFASPRMAVHLSDEENRYLGFLLGGGAADYGATAYNRSEKPDSPSGGQLDITG